MFNYPLADAETLEQIRDRICRTEVAHLITVGSEGHARSRGMEDHNVGADFVFWFATGASSRKCAEIRVNPRVTLAYYEPDSRDYVCVFGRGEVVMDNTERAAFWREGWERYWPGGPTDPDYAIVRVIGEAIEYFDMKNEQLIKVSIPRARRR